MRHSVRFVLGLPKQRCLRHRPAFFCIPHRRLIVRGQQSQLPHGKTASEAIVEVLETPQHPRCDIDMSPKWAQFVYVRGTLHTCPMSRALVDPEEALVSL
jgi:hypothetical protein